MNCTPGPDNSNLISTEYAVPNKPENSAKVKYKVPISLALDDKNHLSTHSVGYSNEKLFLIFFNWDFDSNNKSKYHNLFPSILRN